jgi:hypothetical protein
MKKYLDCDSLPPLLTGDNYILLQRININLGYLSISIPKVVMVWIYIYSNIIASLNHNLLLRLRLTLKFSCSSADNAFCEFVCNLIL